MLSSRGHHHSAALLITFPSFSLSWGQVPDTSAVSKKKSGMSQVKAEGVAWDGFLRI